MTASSRKRVFVPTVVTDSAWCVMVPHSALGARMARHRMAAELAGAVRPTLLADALAVVAELVGNAVRHADPLPGDVIRLTFRLHTDGDRDKVEIRVTDGGAGVVPRVRSVEPDALGGRGLTIVSALARRWGVERESNRQSVWAEVY